MNPLQFDYDWNELLKKHTEMYEDDNKLHIVIDKSGSGHVFARMAKSLLSGDDE